MSITQLVNVPPRGALRGKRGLLDIVNLVLLVCNAGEIKTHVMQRCNLNSRQTQDYITLLLKYGLLEKSKEIKNEVYQTTERGRRFLGAYAELSGIFDLLIDVKEEMPPKNPGIPGATASDVSSNLDKAALDQPSLRV
ncbi:MAG TPA: winged helix-turn-helix domain-containing protein [Nitrososphaerales archaeon]|nr:winged helix-turn-helix domain-containing protein [Nitrososphaerales archaeon]